MFKTIKILEKNYDDIKYLSKELEKRHVIPYIEKVNINSAIAFALNKAKESLKLLEKREKLIKLAGTWEDIDRSLVKTIYESRKKDVKWSIPI